ncbi:hypothetical protein ASC94_10765 [Massilia sp. Root418]|uniref:ATP-binding protein n=1 Tax=Massilia sp. Root418 TaxID=1736532 RepID=UPI000701CF58|nr:ATP-binding protein [Massilia sp. Root418]KQW93153.1 hypothetical protein ASC94_10765 [Massilia sp. Root418]
MSVSDSVRAPGELEKQFFLPVVQALMTTAVALVQARRGILLRVHHGHITVEARTQAGCDDVMVDMRGSAGDLGDVSLPLVEEVIRTGALLKLDATPLSGDQGTDPLPCSGPHRAVVIVPLSNRSGLTGMIYLERQAEATTPTSEQMLFLELLAEQAAVSLDTVRLYVATMHEVNEHRHVAQALRESRALLLLGERINESGSWEWDVEKGELNCSAEFCRLYEFNPDVSSVTHEALMQHIHPCDRERVNRILDEAVAARRAVRFEHRIRARDGAIRYLSVNAHPVSMTDGSLYAGTVSDVSGRKAEELERSRAQEQLARGARMTAISQMTALIAHEVNQPLMSISSNAGAALIGIERDSLGTGKIKELLGQILGQSQRAGTIIQTLQALTCACPQSEPADVHAVIHQVLLTMRGEFNRSAIEVELDLLARPIIVGADKTQLQQVLANLLGNAVDAMQKVQGRVRIVRVSSRSLEGNQIEVCVRDNGTGADAGMYDQMFEPFVGSKPGGIGMGLAISRSIIESHGGRIFARRRLPHGCSVIFNMAEQADDDLGSVTGDGNPV